MGSQQVRRAVRADAPLLADTLQAAFNGYPWTDWAFPADERADRGGLASAVPAPVLRPCDRDSGLPPSGS